MHSGKAFSSSPCDQASQRSRALCDDVSHRLVGTPCDGHHQALQRLRLTSWVGGEGRSPPAKGTSDAICWAVPGSGAGLLGYSAKNPPWHGPAGTHTRHAAPCGFHVPGTSCGPQSSRIRFRRNRFSVRTVLLVLMHCSWSQTRAGPGQ